MSKLKPHYYEWTRGARSAFDSNDILPRGLPHAFAMVFSSS